MESLLELAQEWGLESLLQLAQELELKSLLELARVLELVLVNLSAMRYQDICSSPHRVQDHRYIQGLAPCLTVVD